MFSDTIMPTPTMKSNWVWTLVFGILFMVLGFVGLGMSIALTMIGIFFFGTILIIGGLCHFCAMFKNKDVRNILWHLFSAFLYIIAGCLIIYDPILASGIITFFVAGIFIALGVSRLISAFTIKSSAGSWWLVLAGIAGLLVGISVIAQWPVSSFWFIGMLIAIEMLITGWSYVLIALSMRKMFPDPKKL